MRKINVHFYTKVRIKISPIAFSGNFNISSIIVDSDNPIYDSRENCNAIIETATNILISGCNNSTIPDSVDEIGKYAFSNCNKISTIIIPNSVKKINEYAFTNTSPEGPSDLGLNYIVIPYSVYEICKDAFSTCENLDLAVIMNHNTNIDKEAFPKWTKIFKFQRDTMYTIN